MRATLFREQGETGEVGIRARYAEMSTRSTEFNGINPNFVDGTQETRTVSANWKKLLSDQNESCCKSLKG